VTITPSGIPGKLLVAVARQRVWFAAILGIAAVSRLLDLGSRALHHDESIHAATALQRLFEFPYVYDPLYHGPFLYFAVALVFALTDISDGAARLLPAISGIALICAVGYLLRDGLGRVGTPLAMFGLTLSTAFLYYSRFLRNDIFIALLTLLAMAALYRYLREPRRRWVLLAATAFGISLVTKENAYISGFIFTVALAALGITGLLRRRSVIAASPQVDAIARAMTDLVADRRGLALALAVMAVIPITLYSSFGVNLELVPQAFYDSVAVWAQVHQSGRIDQPWFFYPALALLLEPWATVFGAVGFLIWIRRPSLFAGLLVWWMAASFAVYTLAGEKAAWLSLHPLLPTYLLAAWASDRLLRQCGGVRRIAVLVLAVILLALTARHAIATTFLYGDVPRTPIAYSQTSRDIPAAVELFEEAGNRSGHGWALPIHVGQAAHWPFVWYLRGFSAIDFFYGQPDPATLDQAALILSGEQASAFDGLLEGYESAPIRIRVWFPEHVYKSWTWDSVVTFFIEPKYWQSLAEFVISHKPPAPIGSSEIYLYIREDIARLGLDPAQAWKR
jgi:uncharacterized protein (TIGR03663 family)